jgi:hypothetical protein
MPLKASDALIHKLFAPHLTREDGEANCVYGMHEPFDDWVMYLFVGGLLRFFLLKHLLIAVTERRLLLMEISGFYQEKNCQSIEFDEVEQVQVQERSVFGFPVSIARLKVLNGNKYRITIKPAHPGISRHEESYRKVISFFKSLAGEAEAGIGQVGHFVTRPCPQCAERVKLDAKVCRFCNYRFSDQEIATARSQAGERTSVLVRNAQREQLQRGGKRRLLAGWILIVAGSLLLVFFVLGSLLPAPEGKPENKFAPGPFIGGLAFFLIAFITPGLFLLGRARKLKRELAMPDAAAIPSSNEEKHESQPNNAPTARPHPKESQARKILFGCPHCHKRLGVGPQLAGKRAKCSGCGKVIQIPDRGAKD